MLGVQFVRRKCYSYLHVLKKTPFQLRELLFNFSLQHRSIPFFVKVEFVNYKTFPLQLHSSIICVGTLSCFGLGIRTISLHTGFFALLEHSYTLSVWRLRFPPRAVTCVERKASAWPWSWPFAFLRLGKSRCSFVIAPARFCSRGQNPKGHPRIPRVYAYKDEEDLLKK